MVSTVSAWGGQGGGGGGGDRDGVLMYAIVCVLGFSSGLYCVSLGRAGGGGGEEIEMGYLCMQ